MKLYRDFNIAFLSAIWGGLLLMSTMTACSTLGYENVDTARKAIIVANAEIRAANLLLQDLVVRNVINDEDAQASLQSLRQAHGELQTAQSALTVADDPATANTGLERANRALGVALIILSAHTGEP